MLTVTHGNLLDADVEALVNAVNTVGVMGKGIALAFRHAYPENYLAYRRACSSGELRLGRVHVHDHGEVSRHRYVVNFPTKGHWRSASRLPDIEAGLRDLVRVVGELSVSSLAVPALGCGNGGLAWSDVRPAIESAFEGLPGVRVNLYAPSGQEEAGLAAPPVRSPRSRA